MGGRHRVRPMRVEAAIALIGLAAGTAAGSAPVPLTRANAHLYLEAKVNQSTGTFILDTGANVSLVELDFARSAEAGLPGEDELTSGLASIYVARLSVGGAELRHQAMVYSRDAAVRENSRRYDGVAADGILGINILRAWAFTIDYHKGTLSFAGGDVPDRGLETVRLKVVPDMLRRGRLHVSLSKGGGAGRAILVDTGADWMVITREAAAQWGVLDARVERPERWNGVPCAVFWVNTLELDQVRLADLKVFVPEEADAMPEGAQGLLGNQVLERFGAVTFDLPRGEIVMGIQPSEVPSMPSVPPGRAGRTGPGAQPGKAGGNVHPVPVRTEQR